MEETIVQILGRMIVQAENNISAINKRLAEDPSPSVQQLHALRTLQNVWRDIIDRSSEAKRMFK